MGFLAPFFLAGAAAVALPILFHMIRRQPPKKIPFSSAMFLTPVEPLIKRRSRISDWLLLLLRCLALILLVFGFSRPFWAMKNDGIAGDRKRLVVLLDRSASMQGERWEKAVKLAIDGIESLKPDDQAALILFDREPRVVISLGEWLKEAPAERLRNLRNELETTKAGWSSARPLPAFESAAQIAADREHGLRKTEVVVISDFQKSIDWSCASSTPWPEGTTLVAEAISDSAPNNAGISLVSDGQEIPKVRVTAASGSLGKFSIRPPDPAALIAVDLPKGGSRLVRLAPEVFKGGGTHLELIGDKLAFDNTAFFAPVTTQTIDLKYTGAESIDDPSGPGFFLQKALSPTKEREFRMNQPETASSLWIASDLKETQVDEMRSYLENGGTVLGVIRQSARGWMTLLGASNVEAKGAQRAILSAIDFRDPLFTAFADPRFSDFSRIHFWIHWRFEGLPAQARIVASYDDEDPALIRVPFGKGELILLTSSWTPANSQLALSTKFAPLLYAAIEQATRMRTAPEQFYVGDTVPIPGLVAAIRKPDGTDVAVSPEALSFSTTDLPGIYSAGKFQFAVNVDPAETEITPRTPAELRAFGFNGNAAPAEKAEAVKGAEDYLAGTEAEGRQRLWRWLILATLGILVLETSLAAMQRKPKEAT